MKKLAKIVSASLAVALGFSLVACGKAGDQAEHAVGNEPVKSATTFAGNANDLGGYLFVTFIGDGSGGPSAPIEQEQIYFALSRDAFNWTKLNDAKPVLYSNKTIGEGGVRDPSIVRKPDGSGFYIVATDLSVQSWNADWGGLQRDGSHHLIIWESNGNSLVDWKAPFATPNIAVAEAGCTWAPEAFWDKNHVNPDSSKGAYMVFWASMVNGRHRIYRAYTKDFTAFEPTEIYMDEGGDGNKGGRPWIDATIVEENGVYYRFTKHENVSKIYMEKSTSLDGPFEMVSTYALDGKACYDYSVGYEGPTAFKLNGQDKWCLFLDNFGGEGYVPFFTDDLSTGVFTKSTDVHMDGTYRHGSIIPITNAEYEALNTTWGTGVDVTTGSCVYTLDFNASGANTGADKVTVNGTVTYEDRGGSDGYCAVINGNDNYLEVNADFLAGLNCMTVTYDAYIAGTSWMFFACPNKDDIIWSQNNACKYIATCWGCDNYNGIQLQRLNQNSKDSRPGTPKSLGHNGAWVKVAMVIHTESCDLYVNGTKVSSEMNTLRMKDILGDTPIIQLGRANWGGGEYSNYKLGNLKIYNYVMDATAIAAL